MQKNVKSTKEVKIYENKSVKIFYSDQRAWTEHLFSVAHQ